MNQLIQKLFK